MTTTLEAKYGSNNQALTITITSLANNAQQGCAAVDNTSNLFLDVLVFLKIKSGTVVAPSTINVYAAGSADGGTTYSDGVTGTNAAQTLTSPPNAPRIGVINAPVSTTTYFAGPFSVAAAFGGVLPDHWAIVVENKTGNALDASIASAWYQGVQGQSV